MNPTSAYSSYFNGGSLPIGYTPASLGAYFQGQLDPIQRQTAQNVGSAQTSAIARGLAGTPTETGAVGTAQHYGDIASNQALGNLSMNMAGLANQDALIKSQQDWQSGENALNRDQATKLAQMGYNFGGNQAATANRYGYQSGIAGLAAGAAGLGAMRAAYPNFFGGQGNANPSGGGTPGMPGY
jgi:hypothetical protein